MTDDTASGTTLEATTPTATGGPLHPAALAAVARTRARGLHFWGRMLGIDTVMSPDGTPMLRAAGECDPTTVATLTDVCLGQAIRTELGNELRLATTSLTLQHVADPVGPVTCGSRVVWMHPDQHRALAQAYAEDAEGALVATARAWFSVLPLPAGTTIVPMPWEREPEPGELPRLVPADLTPDELASARAATAALQRRTGSGRPLAEELLGATWRHDGENRLVGTAALGPHLGNRIGMLQGGALYGLAATAAQRLAGPDLVLAEGSLQYLRPGQVGDLVVTATMTRRGRTAAFVDILVEIDGREVATGHHTFFAA